MTKPFDFNQSLKELESITAWFESDELDLDEAIPKFERGMELAALLRDHLKIVENKVEKIKQRFDVAEATPMPATNETGEPELF